MYNPIVAMLVAAANATELPRLGKLRQNARNAASQTVRAGDLNRLSTRSKNCGSAPSREKANIMRELLVREKRPQCQTQRMMSAMRTSAPLSPKTSTRICSTGCSYCELMVRSKSWMEKSRHSIKKKPNTADTPMLVRTPMGADQAALCVSSER